MGSHESSVASAMDSIRRIVRALRLSSRAVERDLGISGAQLFVLQQLAEEGAQSIAGLAGRTATDQSSVSVVVSRLVERGLVTRRASKQDARRAEVALTPAGRGLLRRARSAPAQARLVRAIESLPPEEQSAFSRTLEGLVLELGAAGTPAAMFFEEERPATMGPRAVAPGPRRRPARAARKEAHHDAT